MDTLHLEGFSESLRGSKVYCVATLAKAQPFLHGCLDRLASDLSHRGRKVLVHQGAPRWLQRLGWDATFHLRDTQDLKLALTFIQHMTKPGQVVWVGDISPSVMAILSKVELSLICIGEAPSMEWDAIFWTSGATVEDVEPVIAARMGSQPRLKAILSELRSSAVGLVWSSIREDRRGSLYWYDPVEGGALPMDPEETADILRNVADSLFRR